MEVGATERSRLTGSFPTFAPWSAVNEIVYLRRSLYLPAATASHVDQVRSAASALGSLWQPCTLAPQTEVSSPVLRIRLPILV
jgi:hypothetical protein